MKTHSLQFLGDESFGEIHFQQVLRGKSLVLQNFIARMIHLGGHNKITQLNSSDWLSHPFCRKHKQIIWEPTIRLKDTRMHGEF